MFMSAIRLGGSMSALDRAEAALARVGRALERPAPYYLAAGALVVLALLVRLALAAKATDVSNGHPDSWVFFHQAYVDMLGGNAYPDHHRGSGWQLLLFATFSLLGIAPGDGWTGFHEPMTGAHAEAALVAHTLSACLAAGAVAATLLLGRELLSRAATLLAATLVVFDPFLLRTSTSAMSEPLYVPLFVLAVMTVLRARRNPAWLVATGALMALAHVLRVNGLVMYGALGIFAWLLLRAPGHNPNPRTREPASGVLRWSRLDRKTIAWGAASVAVFFLVASPYLYWRETEGAGAFDYGTNQRFWADDLWDLDDAWWQGELAGERIPRESASDYFARHDLADAAERLAMSLGLQVFDLVGSGRYPAWTNEGGPWVGSPQEESALTPLVAALALVAAFTAMKRREWWFLPVALGFTMLTFVWIYPLVRSVRYWAPLIPLFTLAAVAGWQHLSTMARRPFVVGTAIFGAYLLIYATTALLHLPDGVRLLAENADVRAIAAVTGAVWLLVALAPAVDGALAWARGVRVDERRVDEAP